MKPKRTHFFITRLIILLTSFLRSMILFAAMNCSTIFGEDIIQDRSTIEKLGSIPSPYERFTSDVKDIEDSRSFVETSSYESGLESKSKSKDSLDTDKFLVVEISLSRKMPFFKKKTPAIVISNRKMVLLFNDRSELNRVTGYFYKDQELKLERIRSYNGKTICILTSATDLDISKKDSIKTDKVKNLREFLSLDKIPQSKDESEALRFLYPLVDSVATIHLSILETDSMKYWILDDILVLAKELEEGTLEIQMNADSNLNEKLKQTFVLVQKLLRFMYLTQSREFFSNSSFTQKETDSSLEEISKSFNLNPQLNLRKFLDQFYTLISSESMQRLYGGQNNEPDFSNLVGIEDELEGKGFDSQIEELVGILVDMMSKYVSMVTTLNSNLALNISPENIDTTLKLIQEINPILVNLSDDSLVSNVSIIIKKLVYLYASLYTKIQENKESTVGTACSGVIVSSNTIITAAHCFNLHSNFKLNKKAQISIKKDGTLIQSEAYYIHPNFAETIDPVRMHTHDLALIRFPDGTFSGMKQVPIGINSSIDSGIGVGTQGSENIRKIFLLTSLFDPKDTSSLNRGHYQSFKATTPGDSGSALFGKDDRLIGILNGGKEEPISFYALIQDNLDFFNTVLIIDSKVKIKGLNLN